MHEACSLWRFLVISTCEHCSKQEIELAFTDPFRCLQIYEGVNRQFVVLWRFSCRLNVRSGDDNVGDSQELGLGFEAGGF